METDFLDLTTEENAYPKVETVISEMGEHLQAEGESIEALINSVDETVELPLLCTVVHKADAKAAKLRESMEWYSDRIHKLHLDLRGIVIQKPQNTPKER
jgi:hypothetical protein